MNCVYCERETFAGEGPHATRRTKDHVIPKVLGDFGRYNIVTACADCNHLKNGRTPPEMRALADMAGTQARRWRAMADQVDRHIAASGLLAPWVRET